MKAYLGIAAALGSALLLAACGKPEAQINKTGNLSLGADEDAAVTVVEYASVTCGACAAWNEQVWPEFKTKYVDTKKVRYVLHEYPTPPQDIAVAGFLLARCAGEDKYYQVVDQIMRAQQEMATTAPRTVLLRIAQEQGMDEEGFKNCISDPEAVAAMGTRIQQAQAVGVSGTPTFTVNGQVVNDKSLAGLSAVIDPLLEAKP